MAAGVKAFASTAGRKVVGTCIEYEKLLDSQRSTGNAGFDLTIPGDTTSYVVSYCEPGYRSRVEDYNTNNPDGAPVEGEPVDLKRDNAAADVVAGALAGEIRRLANTVNYLNQSSDDSALLAEMQKLMPAGMDAKTVLNQIVRWRQIRAQQPR